MFMKRKTLSKIAASLLAVLVVGAGEPASRPAVSTLDQVLARMPRELRSNPGEPWTIQEAEYAGKWIETEIKGNRIQFESIEADYRGGKDKSADFKSGILSKRYGVRWSIAGSGKLTDEADAAFSAKRSDKTWRVSGVISKIDVRFPPQKNPKGCTVEVSLTDTALR